jgi:hypothetical protein
VLFLSALSVGGGNNHECFISAVITSSFSLLQSCDVKKMSLSSLLEASAKGKGSSAQFYVYRMFY